MQKCFPQPDGPRAKDICSPYGADRFIAHRNRIRPHRGANCLTRQICHLVFSRLLVSRFMHSSPFTFDRRSTQHENAIRSLMRSHVIGRAPWLHGWHSAVDNDSILKRIVSSTGVIAGRSTNYDD
jgi:hypothetical protein